MTDDLDDVECVAIVLVDQFARTAARFVRDQAEISAPLPEMPSAETWRDIATAIDKPGRKA